MTKTRYCTHCKADTTQAVHQKITSSGALFYGWRCPCPCDRWVPKKGGGFWISKEELASAGVDLENLPVVFAVGDRCSRCGERGAEEHHWMPVGLVGIKEADKWPKDYLCKPCHDEWHKITTPSLVFTPHPTGNK